MYKAFMTGLFKFTVNLYLMLNSLCFSLFLQDSISDGGFNRIRCRFHTKLKPNSISLVSTSCRTIGIQFLTTCFVIKIKMCLFCKYYVWLVEFTAAMCICIKTAWFFPQNKICLTNTYKIIKSCITIYIHDFYI